MTDFLVCIPACCRQELGHLLLSQPGLLAGLAKEYPELKLLVAQLKSLGELGIPRFTRFDESIQIIHRKSS